MSDETTRNPESQETDRQKIDTYPDPIVDVIPFGSVCLFAGASGAGKTIMQTEWIARWQQGRTIWGHETQCPNGFYYLAADRGWRTYHFALEHAGVDRTTLHKYCLAEDPKVDFQAWVKLHAFDRLKYCLKRLQPVPGSLLILEPFVPLFVTGNVNNASDAAISVHYLRSVARDYQVTILASANVGKMKQDEAYIRPQDRIAGSGALIAYSDTQMYLFQGEKPGQPHTFGWVPRLSAPEEFRTYFDPETKLFRPDAGIFEKVKLSRDERILALLAMIPTEEPIERGDLEERAETELDVSRATVDRDLQQLKLTGFIEWTEYGMIRRKKPD